MQETYFAAAKESWKDKNSVQKGLLSILHGAGICQIEDRWIGNALDTE